MRVHKSWLICQVLAHSIRYILAETKQGTIIIYSIVLAGCIDASFRFSLLQYYV